MLEEGLRLRFKIGAYLPVILDFGVEGGEDGGNGALQLYRKRKSNLQRVNMISVIIGLNLVMASIV